MPQMDAKPAIIRGDILLNVAARVCLIDTLNVVVLWLAACRLGDADIVDKVVQDVVCLGCVIVIVDAGSAIGSIAARGGIVDIVGNGALK